jgi:hypothetical protein
LVTKCVCVCVCVYVCMMLCMYACLYVCKYARISLLWNSQQIAIFSLIKINGLVNVNQVQCVYCEVRNKSLSFSIISCFKWFKHNFVWSRWYHTTDHE